MNGALIAGAIEHAAAGRPVFPCRGKVPLTGNGFHDATTDPAAIKAMFRAPDAAVAICTGKASGLVVLDVDGDDGAESLRQLERERGELPRTASVKTPRGGQHFYFQHPGGEVRNSTGKLGCGLDVRGDGGYVVAPPSPGYLHDEVAPVAAPPEWLVGLMRMADRKGGETRGADIPNGERNTTLASARRHHASAWDERGRDRRGAQGRQPRPL